MNRIRIAITTLLFVLAGTVAAVAQTGDELMTKHIAAVGGADNWNKIKSVKMTGSMSMQGMDMNITQTTVNEKGVRIDISVMGMTGYTIITPEGGWAMQPGMDKPMPLPADMINASKAKMNVKTIQLVDKAVIAKADYVGRETIDKAACYKIKVTGTDGTMQTVYLDPATYYMVRMEMSGKIEGQEQEAVLNFGNFQKQKEGIVMPMSMTGPMGVDIAFNTIEINGPVSDGIFKPQ